MSATQVSSLSQGELVSYVYSYAALILADAKKPITAKALDAIVTASGNKADKSWATLLEKSFASRDINNLCVLGGGCASGSSGSQVQAAAPKGGAVEKKVEEPKKVEKVEEPEEDFDMGDLFG